MFSRRHCSSKDSPIVLYAYVTLRVYALLWKSRLWHHHRRETVFNTFGIEYALPGHSFALGSVFCIEKHNFSPIDINIIDIT